MCSDIHVLRFLIELFLVLHVVTPIASMGHKYDMDEESQKLYGEDFKAVLKRFRRTPDYLKILNDKRSELKVYCEEMSLQVLHFYSGKMANKVGDKVGVVRNEDGTTPNVYFHAFDARRDQEGEDQTPKPEEEVEQDKEAIQALDNYMVFSNKLSVSERNSFRDLGFEFAGNVIHTIIENMGPTDAVAKSTRQPDGGQDSNKTPTSTQHPHIHTVKDLSSTVHRDDQETTSETYRFRSPWNKVESFFEKWPNQQDS